MEKTLEDIYYDPRHLSSFGGVSKLYSAAKPLEPGLTRKTVENWLKRHEAYTHHKIACQKFKRGQITVAHEGQQLQAVLLDIRNHNGDNRGVNYLLMAVECFSSRGWAIPVKYKTGEKVAKALNMILEGTDFFALQTDKGKEFYNNHVEDLLKRRGIKHFSVENDDIKASMVEILIRLGELEFTEA